MPVRLSKEARFETHLVFMTSESRKLRDFRAEAGEVAVQYDNNVTRILGGLGDPKQCTPRTIRATAAKCIQKAIELKRERVSVIAPRGTLCGRQGVIAALEGVLLGAYRFTKYKSDKPFQVKRIELVTSEASAASVREAEVVCEGTNYARDLVNDNAGFVTPERLAHEARLLARLPSVRVRVLDHKAIEREGLGLLAAVGQGSVTPPRLIFIEYTGSASAPATAIVGKGITFDSGGQNLKPTGHIETMRGDMAGAAAVLGLMRAAATLRPKVRLVGVIAAAHNAIGSRAFFPGDIYTSYEGKTVEINSTDAEGRLVLADAIAYCRARYKPARIIDLATLTGGILYALGELVAGLFSNDNDIASGLFDAGERTGERLWRFPLYQEYCDSLKGELSDLRNLSKFKKGQASSITGAAFIKEFCGDTPWAHLDIAGTAFNEGSWRGEVAQYGTGFGVRLLWEFLK